MSPSVTQAVDASVQFASIERGCLTAAIALYVFDRCVGAGQAIKLIWRRGHPLVSILYVLLQTMTICLLSLEYALEALNLDCTRSYALLLAIGAAEAVYWGLLAAISALRVYALSGRDWRLSALVFVLLIVRIVYQIFAMVTAVAIPVPPPIGCAVGPASPVVDPLYIASLASSSAADAIVFIITWRCTYHVIRLARQENIKASLSSLLLRDGTIYFALLFIMNCLCIVTYLLEVFTGLSYLAIALSSIVLSRLLLNLLEASLSADSVSRSLDGGTASSDIRFSRGVDVFGATLSLDQDYDDEDDAAGPGGEPTADEDEDPRSFEE